ncbi:MAG: GAF domain-containing protein [Inhella sp.]
MTLADPEPAAAPPVSLDDALQQLHQARAELAVVNTVQQAMSAQLGLHALYERVGEQLRQIFGGRDLNIRILDPQLRQVHWVYLVEGGQRLHLAPSPLLDRGYFAHVLRTGECIVVNEDIEAADRRYSGATQPGTQSEKALVMVPLRSGQQVCGALNLVDLEREHAFSPADVRLLQTLAGAMGVAMENARLFDETQRLLKETEQRNAELAVINSVQAALAAELDLQRLYEAVGDKLREVFGGRDVGIRIFDAATRMEHFPYIYERGVRLQVASEPWAERGVSAQVQATGQPLVVQRDMATAMAALGSYILAGSELEKSVAFFPLKTGDTVHGLISLIDMEHEQAFSESDLRLLQTLANSLSVALENARLFDETQRLLKETEQRNAELAVINSIQRGMAGSLDFQGIVELVGDKLRELLKTENLGIVWHDPQTNLLHNLYIVEHDQRLHVPPSEPAPNGSWARIQASRQPLVFGTVAEMEAIGIAVMPGTDQALSVLKVPVIVGDRVLGIIDTEDHQREHAYGEAEVRLLQTIASSMGVALENARLFDETQRLLQETDARAAELAVINGVQQGLANKLDAQAIYELVGERLRELFDSQSISIAEVSLAENRRHFAYLLERGQRHQVPDGPLSTLALHLIHSRAPLLINADMDAAMAKLGIERLTVPGTVSAQSLLRVPVLVGDEVVALIGLDNVDREHAFSAADVRLLTTLAGSMSVALESARLFQQTQQRADELATVNALGQSLTSSIDLGELIQGVGEKMRETFKADIAYIALLDEAAGCIRFPYAHGEVLDDQAAGEGLTGKIIETGQALLLNEDVDAAAERLGAEQLGAEAASYLGVPIRVGERAIGVLSVQSTQRESPSPPRTRTCSAPWRPVWAWRSAMPSCLPRRARPGQRPRAPTKPSRPSWPP